MIVDGDCCFGAVVPSPPTDVTSTAEDLPHEETHTSSLRFHFQVSSTNDTHHTMFPKVMGAWCLTRTKRFTSTEPSAYNQELNDHRANHTVEREIRTIENKNAGRAIFIDSRR